MKAVAKLRNCHMSERKMRLVADLVRGLPIGEALNVLKFTKKEASTWIEKTLLSAIANWENKNQGAEADDYDLFVNVIRVDGGAFLKRFRPAPHGRAHRIRKRTCHIYLEVDNKILLPSEEEGMEELVEESEEDMVEIEENLD
jgi:large subunit ribosomal protein L22